MTGRPAGAHRHPTQRERSGRHVDPALVGGMALIAALTLFVALSLSALAAGAPAPRDGERPQGRAASVRSGHPAGG